MDVLGKLVTAIKGGLAEAGEASVDSQALRILDQEIREAAEELNQSRDALASMIARQKLSEDKAAKLQLSIDENEGYAIKSLDKGKEKLALDVAAKIAELETLLAAEKEVGEGYSVSADAMRISIAKAEKDVLYMKAQLDTVKATENVQRAEAAVSKRHSGANSKLRTAMESLERIKEKQALASAQMNVAQSLELEENPPSLEKRLEDAGIKDVKKADDVLERIKQNSS